MNEKRSAILHSRVRVLAKRRIYVGLAIQPKSCASDTDDGVGFPLPNKVLPDRFSASAEAALPQTVADDRNRCRAGLVFCRQKRATFD